LDSSSGSEKPPQHIEARDKALTTTNEAGKRAARLVMRQAFHEGIHAIVELVKASL